MNADIRGIGTLGGHQGDGTRARTDVQHPPVGRAYGHGSAKKDTVSVDLHGAAFIYDLESLEAECTHS
jgi:hypothetical protein